MSIQKDRRYWRVKYWDDFEGEGINKYFGDDKASALAHATMICDLKIRKWQKRKEEYMNEYEALMQAASKNKISR